MDYIQKIATFIVTHIVRPLLKIVSVLKTKSKGKQAAKYQERGGGGSNAVGLADLSNFSFHCRISHTKSVKMHGYKTGQYIKPAGRELYWQASLMDILV